VSRMYEVVTGEVVRIYADNEEQMWEKLATGDYQFVETDSTIRFVGADDNQETE
jgi:hypothetical protein